MKLLLLQLFWLSFAVIGFAEVYAYHRLRSRRRHVPQPLLLVKSHWLVQFLLAQALGMASFAPIVAMGCFLQFPIGIVAAYYGVLIVLAAAVLVKDRTVLARSITLKKSALSVYLFAAAALVVLVLDYILWLQKGGIVDGDARSEIAQITLFAQQHLTLADPIFGDAGAEATAFSTSIQHALQATAANVMRTSAAWVWFYSAAFFRLLVWLGLFGLAWEFLDKKARSIWSYTVVIVLVLVQGTLFEYGELHNHIVVAWTAVFILGLKFWLEAKSLLPLYAGAVLVAATHPLNAFMAACFLGLLAGALLLLRLTTLKKAGRLLPAFVLLLIPIALFFYYPHGLTSAGFNDGPFIGPRLVLHSLGPIVFNTNLPDLNLMAVPIVAFVGLCVWMVRRANIRQRIWRGAVACIALITSLLVVTLQWLSLLGYGYFIARAKKKQIRVLLVLLVVFAALVIYNPLVLSTVHGRFPDWTASRFYGLNVLAYVAPIIGLLYMLVLPFEYLKFTYKHLITAGAVAAILVYCFVLPVVSPAMQVSWMFARQPSENRENLETYETLANFREQLQGQVVFSDDKGLPAMLPGAVATSVFVIDNEANANAAVHIEQRKACAEQLRQKLEYQNLSNAGITRIITGPYSSKEFKQMLDQRPFVQLQAELKDFRVYKVLTTGNTRTIAPTVCSIPSAESQ